MIPRPATRPTGPFRRVATEATPLASVAGRGMIPARGFCAALGLAALLQGCAFLSPVETIPARPAPRGGTRPGPASAAAAPAQLRAGTAKIDITPPVGTPLAGYSARRGQPSTGAHDPLYARALAVTNGAATWVVVSCDLLIIDDHLYDAVLARIQQARPLPRESLWLVATHTHSGPGGYGRKFVEKLSMGHYDPSVFQHLTSRISEAALQAMDQVRLVQVGTETEPAPGLTANRLAEDGPTDPAVTVWGFRDDRSVMAVMVHFAAHPTILSSRNREFSADYPGAVAQALETRMPGSVCLLIPGALGDQRPVTEGAQSDDRWVRVRWYGTQVADAASRALQRMTFHATQQLTVTGRDVPLPPAAVRLGGVRLPSWLGARLLDADGRVSVVNLDGGRLIGVPADLTLETAQQLSRDLPSLRSRPHWWVGFVNDYVGYIIPPRFYGSDAYEAQLALNGPHMDRWLTAALAPLLAVAESSAEASQLRWDGDLPIIVVQGTPYAMGYQHGLLLRPRIVRGTRHILNYFYRQIPAPGLRRWLVNRYLDHAFRQMRPFIPPEYLEELRGLADGSGVPLHDLQRLQAIAEVTSQGCSTLAAFGRATRDGRLYHTRNLDWAIAVGAQEFAAVIIQRPAGKHAFANLGYAGFIGVLSGVNDAGISIGEVGAETVDQTYRGMPMAFVLRKILEDADNLDDVRRLMETTPRTRGYNYVFADAEAKQVMAVEATRSHVAVFGPDDPKERAVNYAAPVADAVFRGDTAFDPVIRDVQRASHGDPRRPGLESPAGDTAYEVRYKRQGELIQERFGQLDADAVRRIAQAVAPSSNVQSVVYAYPEVWVANAKGTDRAAHQPYHHLDLREYFKK